MSVEPKQKISSRLKAGGVIVAMAASTIGSAEGLRQVSYPDPATRGEPWTACYGHTGPDVSPHMRYSLAQCKELLAKDIGIAANGLDQCLTRPTTDGQAVAFLSLAFNIGVRGFCKSSIVRDFNAGRVVPACDDLLKFNRAAGIVFPGLTRRRERERELCLQGA